MVRAANRAGAGPWPRGRARMVQCSPDATEASMPLTDTQLVVLSAALAREDGLIFPLPTTLKGGAVTKVCSVLLAKGLAEEVALSCRGAQAAPEKVFRTAEDEKPITLRITALGRKALNGEAADEPAKVPKKKAAGRAWKATTARRRTPHRRPERGRLPVLGGARRRLSTSRARGRSSSSSSSCCAGRGCPSRKLRRRSTGCSTRCAARSRARSRRRTA